MYEKSENTKLELKLHIFQDRKNLEKQLFFTFPTIKVSQNYFFVQNFNFSEKYATLAPVWYFHFSRTPSSSRDLMLQSLLYTFLCIRGHPNYNTSAPTLACARADPLPLRGPWCSFRLTFFQVFEV